MTDVVRLIVSDIDGTIINSQHEVTPRLKAAVQQVKERNIPFILASARSPKGMLELAKELNLEDSPMVSYNGGLILPASSDNIPIFSQTLDYTEIEHILSLLKNEYEDLSVNVYSFDDWFVEKIDSWIEHEIAVIKVSPKIEHFDNLIAAKQNMYKVLVIGEADRIREFYDQANGMNFANTSFYLSKDNYLEITHTKVSKETAISALAEYYEIKPSEIMAIGDNYNDLPMLELAGLGIAMANSPIEVKTAADFLTDSNNEDGVAKAIEEHVLSQEMTEELPEIPDEE
jgi:Cof subfamily protein (haloacid dehalogenase superfamily)